jgi:hypothetical protein
MPGRWVTRARSHEDELTMETLDALPVGSVLSVLARFGPDARRVPLSVVKLGDRNWALHGRGGIASDRLVGALSAPRLRREAARRGDAQPSS